MGTSARNTNKKAVVWLMLLTMIFSCLVALFPVQAMATESKPTILMAFSRAGNLNNSLAIENEVDILWSAVDGSVNYAVYRCDVGVSDYVYIGSSSKNAFMDKTVEASALGKEYSYRVGSVDALGTLSELSDAENVKVYTPIGFDFGNSGILQGYSEVRGTTTYNGDATYGVVAKTKGATLSEYNVSGVIDSLILAEFDFYVELPNGKYNIWALTATCSDEGKGTYCAGDRHMYVMKRLPNMNIECVVVFDFLNIEVNDGRMRFFCIPEDGAGSISTLIITPVEIYDDQTIPLQAPWYYTGSINVEKTQVTLTWDAPKNAESYKVYRKLSTAGDSAYICIGTTTNTTYTDNVIGLERGNSYDYVVRSFSSVKGESFKTVKYTATMSDLEDEEDEEDSVPVIIPDTKPVEQEKPEGQLDLETTLSKYEKDDVKKLNNEPVDMGVNDEISVSKESIQTLKNNDVDLNLTKNRVNVSIDSDELDGNEVTEVQVAGLPLSFFNKIKEELKDEKDFNVFGNTTQTMDIEIENEKGNVESLKEPLQVDFDLSKTSLKNVKDLSKLSLVKVVEGKDGLEFIKLGGSYDEKTKTFSALTNTTGKFVVMEVTNITKIDLAIGDNKININGKEIISDVAPQIINDSTMLPVRVVAESLGAKVGWNNDTKTVTILLNGKEVILKIGVEIEGYGKPVIKDDRTLLPIRYVMEQLGANVLWVPSTKEIQIVK